MRDHLLYICPHCETSCSVALDQVGRNVVCPNCSQEFTATPVDSADFQLPETVPFFKSGKLEILKNHLNKLTSDGELSSADFNQRFVTNQNFENCDTYKFYKT